VPCTEFLRDSGVAGVFGMNRERSALMKTRIRPTAVRLAGACLLAFLTATVGAQRNEVLPDPRVDPATGQFLQAEPPVQLDFNRDLRVDVDFERLGLVDIVKYLRELLDFSEVNFVRSFLPGSNCAEPGRSRWRPLAALIGTWDTLRSCCSLSVPPYLRRPA